MGPRFSLLLSLVAQDEVTLDSLPGLFSFMAKYRLPISFNRSQLGLLYGRAFQKTWVERWSLDREEGSECSGHRLPSRDASGAVRQLSTAR